MTRRERDAYNRTRPRLDRIDDFGRFLGINWRPWQRQAMRKMFRLRRAQVKRRNVRWIRIDSAPVNTSN